MYATREEHDDSEECEVASLVRNFTLIRIILFLPCSIIVYYVPRRPIEKLDVKNNVKKDVKNSVKNDVKNDIKNDVKN